MAGGAVIPPILGGITDHYQTQSAAIIALGFVWLYILLLIGAINAQSKKA